MLFRALATAVLLILPAATFADGETDAADDTTPKPIKTQPQEFGGEM